MPDTYCLSLHSLLFIDLHFDFYLSTKKRRGQLPTLFGGTGIPLLEHETEAAPIGALPHVRSSNKLASFPKNESCDYAKSILIWLS